MSDTYLAPLPVSPWRRLSIEASTLTVRALRLTLRDTDSVITALALPVLRVARSQRRHDRSVAIDGCPWRDAAIGILARSPEAAQGIAFLIRWFERV